jgi:outer membrane biosynthesis protein TonB
MTTWKEKQRSRRQIFSNYSLWFYFLISILIHVLVAILIAYQQRSQPTVREESKDEPIEFVIVPPEEKPEKPTTETKLRGADNSVAQGKIRADKPPATEERGSTATDSSLAETKLQLKSPTTPPVKVQPNEPVKSTPSVTETPNLPKPVKPSQPPTPEKINRDRQVTAAKPTPSEEEIL